MMKMSLRNNLLLLIGTLFLTACNSFGPSVLPQNRENYNSALLRSDEQQFLLNIVRMQFGDRPYFIGIDNISTSSSLSVSTGGSYSTSKTHSGAEINPGGSLSNSYSFSPSLSYSDSPTVIFSPLQGDKFIHQMLSPINTDTINLLIESGWSVARVLRITTQHIGSLDNATGASRPSTKHIPQYQDFITFAHFLRKLQTEGLVEIKPGTLQSVSTTDILLNRKDAKNPQIRKLLNMLGIKKWKDTIQLVQGRLSSSSSPSNGSLPAPAITPPPVMPTANKDPSPIKTNFDVLYADATPAPNTMPLQTVVTDATTAPTLTTQPPVVPSTPEPHRKHHVSPQPPSNSVIPLEARSFISILYYLSKSVEITEDDIKSGLVVVPPLPGGKYFDWNAVTTGMMKIHSSINHPKNATVAVFYRDRWFYIEENDVDSKETLAMIEQLFALQAGTVSGPPPVLTLNLH